MNNLPLAYRVEGGAGELFRVLSTILFMTSVCSPGEIWCHKPQIVTHKTCGSKKSSCQWQLMAKMYQRPVSWHHVYELGTIIMSGTLIERRIKTELRNWNSLLPLASKF